MPLLDQRQLKTSKAGHVHLPQYESGGWPTSPARGRKFEGGPLLALFEKWGLSATRAEKNSFFITCGRYAASQRSHLAAATLPGMPWNLKRYYGAGDLHFITCSCYRRQPLLGAPQRRDLFLTVLEQVRRRYQFVVLDQVVVPEHFHLLISEPQERALCPAPCSLPAPVPCHTLSMIRHNWLSLEGLLLV